MNENKKECVVLGYKPYIDKENQKEMLRIVIAVESNFEDYVGLAPVTVFLDSNINLINDLNNAYESKRKMYYKTRENLSTGKTKVIALEF